MRQHKLVYTGLLLVTGAFAGTNWSGTWRVVTSDGKATLGTFTGNCN